MDSMNDDPIGPDTPFRYHLELTPVQLKLTHTALRALLDGFGHDEDEVRSIVQEVLDKLPDEHAIRAIQLDSDVAAQETAAAILTEVPAPAVEAEPGDDNPPNAAA
jgi:HEAT repeat protein